MACLGSTFLPVRQHGYGRRGGIRRLCKPDAKSDRGGFHRAKGRGRELIRENNGGNTVGDRRSGRHSGNRARRQRCARQPIIW